MSGKVRYIFTMRTPIIDNLPQIETEEKNEYELDDCGNKIKKKCFLIFIISEIQ